MAQTLLADLLRERIVVALIFAFAAVQLIMTGNGLPGWQCPVLQTIGYPCPGCGLSRAAVALLRGEWSLSLTLHAFAPILLPVLVLAGIASFLPQRHRQNLICIIERIEKRTWLSVILLVALVVYWIVRLFFPASLTLIMKR